MSVIIITSESAGEIQDLFGTSPNIDQVRILQVPDESLIRSITAALRTTGHNITSLEFRLPSSVDVSMSLIELLHAAPSLRSLKIFQSDHRDSLQAQNNIIVQIADILSRAHITELTLTGYSFNSEGAKAISSIITNQTTLERLDLSISSIRQSEVVHIASALEQHTSITFLNLGNGVLNREGASALARMITRNITLKDLDIGYNSITSNDAMSMLMSLEQNRFLTSLSIRVDNEAKACGLPYKIGLSPSLKHLRVLFAYHLPQEGAETTHYTDFTPFVEKFATNTNIKKLTIDIPVFGENEAIALASLIKASKTLTEIEVLEYKVTAETCAAYQILAEAMQYNSTLQELFLYEPDDDGIESDGDYEPGVEVLFRSDVKRGNDAILAINNKCSENSGSNIVLNVATVSFIDGESAHAAADDDLADCNLAGVCLDGD